MTKAKNIPITGKTVSEWFRAVTTRGVVPDAPACRELARKLEKMRVNKASGYSSWEPSQYERRMGAHARARQKFGRAFLKEITFELSIARRVAGDFRHWQRTGKEHQQIAVDLGHDETVARLDTLAAEVRNNRDIWDKPWRTSPGKYWHPIAESVAHDAERLLKSAGRSRVSFEKDSPLIRFVATALAECGLRLSPATIASALRRRKQKRKPRAITRK